MKMNASRIIDQLNAIYECGKHGDGSYSRVAFSPEDVLGRERFMDYFRSIGVKPYVDAAGNIIARLAGKNETLPAIMVGSHLDTVPNGGKYDGALGCVAGLGVCQTLVESGHVLEHPLEVVVFADEEGARFGNGLLGVGAFCAVPGHASGADVDVYGMTRDDVFKSYGIDVSSMAKAARDKDSVHCFLELHVEQGASLYKNHIPIGIVSSIAGVKRYEITVSGEPNHSGSTMMSDRKDALVTAAKFIASVPDVVAGHGNEYTVATVGTIQVSPGSVNVVPGVCKFSLEIRDRSAEIIDTIESELKKKLAEVCEQSGETYTLLQIAAHDPAPMTDWVQDAIETACKQLEYEFSSVPSGAFHDSLVMSSVFPTGMIFIPSVNGISHSPLELSLDADIEKGCNVLLNAVLAADSKR